MSGDAATRPDIPALPPEGDLAALERTEAAAAVDDDLEDGACYGRHLVMPQGEDGAGTLARAGEVIAGLRAKLGAIAALCGEGAPAVAVDRIEAILRSGEEP